MEKGEARQNLRLVDAVKWFGFVKSICTVFCSAPEFDQCHLDGGTMRHFVDGWTLGSHESLRWILVATILLQSPQLFRSHFAPLEGFS